MISTESSGFKKIMGRAVALMLIAWTGIQATPQLNLSISYGEFSPDGDGFQDFVWINADSSNHPLRTKDWILTVRDSDGTRIRQIQADHRKVRPLRGVGNLFLPGKYDVAAPILPERIYWNGRDDGGKTVRDGLYRLSLQGEWLEGGYFSQDFQVRIDSRKPVVKINATSPTLARPYAADGSLQQPTGEITIRQDAPGGAGYTFSGEILSARGELIERRNWTSRLPPSISWNGREPGGSPVEPGNYGYRLIVSDAAGNVVRQELHNLYVTTGRAEVVLDGNRYYTPGANLDLSVRALSGGYSASSYEFQILSGSTVVYNENGSGSIPRNLRFRAGDDLSTGYYSARLIIDRGASRQSTPSFVFFLDRDGTRPSISASDSTFTPDGDYQNDTITFSNSSSGEVPVDSWTLSLVIVSDRDPDLHETFMAFQGSYVLPEKIIWDGVGYEGRQLESFESIVPVLTIKNEAGVTVSADAGVIRTGIVLRAVTPGGVDLVARFPDQGYFDAKGKINSDGEAVVSDILAVIRRYQRYFLRVECHSGIDGREEENLERTEEMAYTIFQEFDGSYWPLDRMTYMGAGETEALYENSGRFQAYRNNRMEFRLEYDNYVEKMEKK